MKTPTFTGVCTALVTPFREGNVNYRKLDELLDNQFEHGVQCVCVCGTTGEASTLSDEERCSIIDHTVQYCNGRMKVIAGTGSNNTEHAVLLSKAADAAGADAVLVVSPYYNKATAQGLIAHYSTIAQAVQCDVILYNVPSRTGVDIPPEVCKTLSEQKNIIGIKEASSDITKTAKIRAACGEDFFLWSGNDDQIVPQMSLGASGVISVLSNLCPADTKKITDACLAGDYHTAAQLQCNYAELINALFCEVNPIPIKHAMNLAGFDVGLPRLPLCDMSENTASKLKNTLISYGIISK